jgi:hypothetical protein|tara:strand:- start:181 stop:441 length:261 start_codon:yes stop_codon:yes gene_type:complete
MMSDDIFDFGFTAVTEEELESVQTLQQTVVEAEGFEDRLNNLYNAIQPLLNNLRKDPEKEYILWPNRLERVEEFSDFLDKIYKGEK